MKKSLLFVLVIIAMLLGACGPAMAPAVEPETETGEVFMIALPRIVIDFDQDGVPSILGMKLEDAARFIGVDLSGLRMQKYYIDWMSAANVQHIEMRQTGDGLALLVNGVPMPHVAWNDASLAQASTLATFFNIQGEQVIRKLMPVVRRLGLNVALTFPVRADMAALPLADPSVAMAAPQPSDDPASAIVKFEIKYDDQGVPAILGISARELSSMGVSLPVALTQDWIRTLQVYNVQNLELRTKFDGLYLYVNGEALPNVVWDDALLTNAADLYGQMNPTSQYIEWAKVIVPLIDNADIGILVHFPLAAGAEPIPAKMH